MASAYPEPTSEPDFYGSELNIPSAGLRPDTYRAWWVRERIREMARDFYARNLPHYEEMQRVRPEEEPTPDRCGSVAAQADPADGGR